MSELQQYTAAEPIRTSDGAVVKPLLYIQDGRALYKISTVYHSFITVTVCFDRNGKAPARTTVRRLMPEQVHGMPVASTRIINRYHDYLDGQRS